MGEIWYRGEVAGAAPAKPGAFDHDIGEGMYLTDRKSVAEVYGPKRTVDPSKWRVYRTELNLSSMRILDLRTDTRWKQSTSINGVSFVEEAVRSGGNLQYARIFNNFLKQHKINLAQYDAVIGPEYLNGGNQICILNKNDKPSALALKIRATFKLESGQVIRPASPKVALGTIRFRGRFGQGLRIAGGTLVLFGVGLLIQILGNIILQKIERKILEKKLRDLQPRIETDVRARKQEALSLLANGKKAFANVQVKIFTVTSIDPEGPVTSMPGLEYHGVTISDKEINRQGPMEWKRAVVDKWEYHPVTMSFAVTFPQEEVEAFSTYQKVLKLYDEELSQAKDPHERTRLAAERDEVKKQLQKALGL